MNYAEGDVNSVERGSGARANKGKVSFSLIPFHLLSGVARVLMGGKLKYAPWNWAKGMKWSTAMDCTYRHLFKYWYCREDNDAESGEHHLDHAICNLLMLKHFSKTYNAGDDRPDLDVTCFDEWLEDVNTPFDEEEYLKRNPNHVKEEDPPPWSQDDADALQACVPECWRETPFNTGGKVKWDHLTLVQCNADVDATPKFPDDLGGKVKWDHLTPEAQAEFVAKGEVEKIMIKAVEEHGFDVVAGLAQVANELNAEPEPKPSDDLAQALPDDVLKDLEYLPEDLEESNKDWLIRQLGLYGLKVVEDGS